MSWLKITLKHSPIGHNETQKRTVRALGLRRLHQTVYQPDNPSIRGMITRIPHLLHVEVVQEPTVEGKAPRGRASQQTSMIPVTQNDGGVGIPTSEAPSEEQPSTPKRRRRAKEASPASAEEASS